MANAPAWTSVGVESILSDPLTHPPCQPWPPPLAKPKTTTTTKQRFLEQASERYSLYPISDFRDLRETMRAVLHESSVRWLCAVCLRLCLHVVHGAALFLRRMSPVVCFMRADG
jgi:hypothetical protein